MKNKLLITTALVAMVSASNAYTMEINSDKEITGKEQEINIGENLIVSNGNLVATDTAIHANGIEITGGNITLSGTDFTNDNLNQSFKLTDGTITMNGNQSVIGTNHGDGDNKTEGRFEMVGGTINVNGSENYIEGGDLNISAGTININTGATLQTLKTIISNDRDAMPGEVATIKLQDKGTINLSVLLFRIIRRW